MQKSLGWGETPWDTMSRDELLREVQRLYWAAHRAKGVLRELRLAWPTPYVLEGPGFKVSQVCDLALRHGESFNSSDVYRHFFRHAASLLFPEIEEPWAICGRCGGMWQSIPAGNDVGRACPDCAYKGVESVLRAVTWDDLKPVEATQQAEEAL